MGLLLNGIYGYRVVSNATLLGSQPINRRNFASNVLTWTNTGDADARERKSFPSGYSTSSFYLPLKAGGIRCTLVGSGGISADIEAIASMTASLAGSGAITPPTLYEAKSMDVTITGGGSVTNAEMRAIANITCTIRIGANPSADDIAQAIWGSIATQFNEGGTMGQKLNGAGSAGDPWSTDLTAGGYTGNQAGKKILDMKDETGLIPASL